jgi:hypothetical protein
MIIIEQIRAYHRQQRFMMKMQSRIDRSMEAYIRCFVFGFSPMLPEAERKEITKKTTALLKQCREYSAPEEYVDIAEMVLQSDASRACWDKLCSGRKRAMEKLAKQVPAAAWVEAQPGVGLHGFAQIIGEAGDLSNYANPAKLWKRLGLAPYDGLAMSTWMRETWRPRKLTSDEWIDNPFKPERYAIMAQIGQWLWVKQWTGKEKAPPDGKPNGHYGEVYARRRAHTTQTHPDWTPMHSHKDALRILMKQFILDLWVEWQRATAALKPTSQAPSALIQETNELLESKVDVSPEQTAKNQLKPNPPVPPAPITEAAE